MAIDRLNYFTGQFLKEIDFELEQDYHKKMLRWHNQNQHTPGVCSGMEVTFTPTSPNANIAEGTAIDNLGRVIYTGAAGIDLNFAAQAAGDWYVVISYQETQTGETNETGITGFARITESPLVEFLNAPSADPAKLNLAKVTLINGGSGIEISAVDNTVRNFSGTKGGQELTIASDPAIFPGTEALRVDGDAYFTGAITNVTDITATGVVTSGSLSTGAITSVIDITASGLVTSGSLSTGAITGASLALTGDITSVTDITASGLVTSGSLSTGAITGASLALTGDITSVTDITASGVVRGNGGFMVDGKVAVRYDNMVHSATSGNNTRYGYYEVKLADNTRGAYFGYGNVATNEIFLQLENGNDLNITGGNVGIGIKPSATLHVGGDLKLNIGEGLHILGETNYFGANLDARIIRMLDTVGAQTNGAVDGGLVIDGQTADGITKEFLTIRGTGDVNISSGNLSVPNGALTIADAFIYTEMGVEGTIRAGITVDPTPLLIDTEMTSVVMAAISQRDTSIVNNLGVMGYASFSQRNIGVQGIAEGNTVTSLECMGGHFEGSNGQNTVGVSASAMGSAGTNNAYGGNFRSNGGTSSYGGYFEATGGTTNYGGFFQAGGGTNNYAGYFSSGNVYIQDKLGIGTMPTTNRLEVGGDALITGMITCNGGLKLNIGEGLQFLADNNYFGTNLDARIIRVLDNAGGQTNGAVDGGLVIDGQTADGISKEFLTIRGTGDVSISNGNLSVSGAITSVTTINATGQVSSGSLSTGAITGASLTLSGDTVISGNVGIGSIQAGTMLNVDGTTQVGYLKIKPQNTTNEGGELLLAGASSNPDWRMDVYTDYLRFISGGVRMSLHPDGNLALTGALTGATTINASGNITGSSLSLSGAITGATTITASGLVSSGSLSTGAITGTTLSIGGGDNAAAIGGQLIVSTQSGQGQVNLVAGATEKADNSGYTYLSSRGASRIRLNDGSITLYTADSTAGTAGTDAGSLTISRFNIDHLGNVSIPNGGNLSIGGNITSVTNITATGAITGSSLSLGGAITNVTDITATGNLQLNGGVIRDSNGVTRVSLPPNNNLTLSDALGASKLTLGTNGYTTVDGQTNIRSTASADLTQNGILSLGYTTGASVALDKNRIQVRSAPSTAGELYLNPYGGKVAVGTTLPPSSALHVGGDMLANGLIKTNTGFETHKSTIYLAGQSNYGWQMQDLQLNGAPALWFSEKLNTTSATLRMGILTGGIIYIPSSIGIGTGAPGADRLDVRGRCYSSVGWFTTSADYGEFFEQKKGVKLSSGMSVVINSDGKIQPAKDGETPIGIVTKTSAVVGNSYKEWPGKYLKDDIGDPVIEEVKEEEMAPKMIKVQKERPKTVKTKRQVETFSIEEVKRKGKTVKVKKMKFEEQEVEEPLLEEVDVIDENGNVIGKEQIPVMETYEEEEEALDEKGETIMVGTGKFKKVMQPKINPEYDPDKEYTPREDRPEWHCVGLLGQLRLKKGQPVAPTWVKMKDITEDVEMWLVK